MQDSISFNELSQSIVFNLSSKSKKQKVISSYRRITPLILVKQTLLIRRYIIMSLNLLLDKYLICINIITKSLEGV